MLLDKFCEEKAFPTIWCGHGRSVDSRQKLSFEDCVLSELRRRDRRAARPDHILFLYKKAQLKQLQSQMNIAFRKNNRTVNVTAEQAVNGEFLNDAILNDNAYRFMAGITGTPAYWEKKKKDVMAMVRQIGNFSLFITLSMAELHWAELLVILKKTIDKEDISEEEALALEFEEKARLIRNDPVTVALYFDHRIKELMKTWDTVDGPFGDRKILHLFYRLELQQRGSAHIHMVLWLSNCPSYTPGPEGNASEVCSFIDSIITTDKDDPEVQEYTKYQKHKCTFTCKKNPNLRCRFFAPFFPMKETKILEPIPDDFAWGTLGKSRKDIKALYKKICDLLDEPGRAETIGTFDDFLQLLECSYDDYILAARLPLNSKKVYLKREPKDTRINGYSKKILRLLRANHDIQFVIDTFACIGYVVDYINKSARGLSTLLRQCNQDCNRAGQNTRFKFRSFIQIMWKFTEISAQEAVIERCRIPLSKSSCKVEFVNTSPSEVY